METKKILIVDDDKQIGHLMEEFLELWGYTKERGFEIHFAFEEDSAVESARNHSYQLIFMDGELYPGNGASATKKIREFDKEVIIVMMSARSEINEQGIKNGANFSIPKEGSQFIEELKNKLKELF